MYGEVYNLSIDIAPQQGAQGKEFRRGDLVQWECWSSRLSACYESRSHCVRFYRCSLFANGYLLTAKQPCKVATLPLCKPAYLNYRKAATHNKEVVSYQFL